MKIKRKFVRFADLYVTDEECKKIIEEACWNSTDTEAGYDHLLKYTLDNHMLINLTDLGCGYLGDEVRKISKLFKELDKTNPYDNKLTYSDINAEPIILEKNDDYVEMFLVNVCDGVRRIVDYVIVKENCDIHDIPEHEYDLFNIGDEIINLDL